MDKRRLSLYLAIGLLLGSAGIVFATHLNSPSDISDGVTVSSPDGMAVNVTGDTQMEMGNMFPDSSTVQIATEEGEITFASSDVAQATVNTNDIEGDWTTVTSLWATGDDITIDPSDKQSITVGGDIESIEFTDSDSVTVDDGSTDFTYSAIGEAKVELGSISDNTRVAAVDANSGEILDDTTSDGNGELAFDSLDSGSHTVLIQSFDPGAPTISNGTPEGDLDSPPNQISFDVADDDFSSGDSVTVNVSLDGSEIHSEVISQNQTVTTSIPQSGQTGGEHNWNVEVEDQYSQGRVDAYTYAVPDQIFIRNETNHSEILDLPIENTVTFFGEDQTYERTTPNGTINMTGLPVNQDFVVQVEPSDENFTSRTVYIQSIYEQQDVYLLNTNVTETRENRFVLEDPTGQFGSDTVVFLQRPMNISGNVTWQTIHSDEFGVEGVTTTLQDGQRYRIKVMNAQGTTQIVGPYRADISETVQVRPGTPTINLGEFTDGWAKNAELDNRTLEYRYSDPHQETDSVTVWIHEKGNPDNQLQPNESYFNLGNFTSKATLSENESDKAWVVNYEIDRGNERFVVSEEVGNRGNLVPDLDREWRLIIGIGMLLLLSGAFSMLNASVGAVVVSVVGALLWWSGFLDGVASFAGIALGMFIAVLAHALGGGRV